MEHNPELWIMFRYSPKPSIGRWKWDTSNPAMRKPDKLDGPPKPDDWTNWVKTWCDRSAEVVSALTVAQQQKPENQWQVHPAIDGCRPAGGERNSDSSIIR